MTSYVLVVGLKRMRKEYRADVVLNQSEIVRRFIDRGTPRRKTSLPGVATRWTRWSRGKFPRGIICGGKIFSLPSSLTPCWPVVKTSIALTNRRNETTRKIASRNKHRTTVEVNDAPRRFALARTRTSTVDRLVSVLLATARYCSLLLAAARMPATRHEHRHAPRPLRYRLSLSYRFYPLSPTIRLQLRHYGHMAVAHFHFYHSPFKPRSN